MAEVKTTNRASKITIRIRLNSLESVSEWELAQIRETGQSLIPLTVKNRDLTGELEGPWIALHQWIEKQRSPVNSELIVNIVSELCEKLKNAGADPAKIVFNPELVFINERRNQFSFLYLPIQPAPVSDPLLFIKDVLFRTADVMQDQFAKQVLNASSLEQLKISETVLTPGLSDPAVDDETVLLDPENDETVLLQGYGYDSSDDETVLPGSGFAFLQSDRGERWELSKECVVIGRSQSRADVICEDSGISNVHASLISRNGRYYLQDENSKNGTFFRGEQLYPKKAVEIFPGESFLVYTDQFTLRNQ